MEQGNTKGTWEERFDRVLKGAAVLYDAPLINDLRKAVQTFPDVDVVGSFSKNQIKCKKWLIDNLWETRGSSLGDVYILGSWCGVLPALIESDGRFSVRRYFCVDIDSSCREVARVVNRSMHDVDNRLISITEDMLNLDFHKLPSDVIINTSCEHMGDNFDSWMHRLPKDKFVVLQSNNFFAGEGHLNCMNSLSEFQQTVGLGREDFAGILETAKYQRYMIIRSV